MSLRRIRIFGDPVLTTPAEPVTDFDEPLRILVDDMMETMDHYRGAGLAANQVGVLRRVFVYNCGGRRGHIVNPVWEHEGDETQYGPEGCLSIDPRRYSTMDERFRHRADCRRGPRVIFGRRYSGTLHPA